MTPAITVLTPTLNAARFLDAMLRSVRDQSLPIEQIEHIVVDAGSRDRTLEVIRTVSPGVRVIVEPGCTIYEAMNIGLAAARGDCVGWLNADDLWRPHALEDVVRTLASERDADLIVGHYDMFDGTTRWSYRTNADVLDRVRTGRMARWFDIWVNPLAAFFRTRTLRALGGYDVRFRLVADWDLWFRAAANPAPLRVAHTGTRLGSFRVHPQSLSAGTRFDRLLEEKREVMTRWVGDDSAPDGVRRCARRMFRHDTLALWAWRARTARRGARLDGSARCAREIRDVGEGLAADLATGAGVAIHEVTQSLPWVGKAVRAAWAATGGPTVAPDG